MKRKTFLSIYLTILFCLSLIMYFGLKNYSQKNFSQEKLKELIYTASSIKDKTDNLCQYQILGEPKVDRDYVKINFWCTDNSKARSTFALIGFTDKSVIGILKEYAKIINFDFNIIIHNDWYCTLNDQEVNFTSTTAVPQASTIDCFQKKGLNKHD